MTHTEQTVIDGNRDGLSAKSADRFLFEDSSSKPDIHLFRENKLMASIKSG